ncbi:hypothetical protein [Bartonella melophagi]|uniref:Uncharacterized protein n=1 Tax=Bartonella melophagi K-2C TaxID=1094557 RepID=J0ZIM7_9HYPH|nr:hypothetical protein [Bartonella melophagi]EJF88068.1 hypothetical protein ME3_01267 [Bartonella melophagi K-2C]
MAHCHPTITQPAIARALREAKKQGCELIEIKPTGELLIYLKARTTSSTKDCNPFSIDDFPPLEDEQEEYTCRSVDGIKF